ncbi:rna-directed dna polymerase from mobile element jockey- hypothetical protein [Limosa lapponica baueri]|uniref:Rna-directed dna polymerase from mobile element jockey-like n=1 Tax=Limosa lapponica baueri TaxID=1758121 RepID=A0A2I0UMN7_LIMLA|nr:rna-directed dna polymerase from mobile element jockey- hypothetical protein [Limosa lapponica baueri]
MEQLILEVTARHIKDTKIIRSCQHGFTKIKSCLTNMVSFYSGVVDERTAVDIVYLNFRNTSDNASHEIHVEKLLMCGPDEQTVWWI